MPVWHNIIKKYNIKMLSIIIYSVYNNNILLLLGSEADTKPNKTDIGQYSEFYHNLTEADINIDKTLADINIPLIASRILFEKTMNLITEPDEFEKMIINNQIPFLIHLNQIIFVYKINYNKHKLAPDYYNRIYRYLSICSVSNSLNNKIIESCPIGFFDKSELKWFDTNEIINFTNIKKRFLKNLIALIDNSLIDNSLDNPLDNSLDNPLINPLDNPLIDNPLDNSLDNQFII
jgi:hypothetical protein